MVMPLLGIMYLKSAPGKHGYEYELEDNFDFSKPGTYKRKNIQQV